MGSLVLAGTPVDCRAASLVRVALSCCQRCVIKCRHACRWRHVTAGCKPLTSAATPVPACSAFVLNYRVPHPSQRIQRDSGKVEPGEANAAQKEESQNNNHHALDYAHDRGCQRAVERGAQKQAVVQQAAHTAARKDNKSIVCPAMLDGAVCEGRAERRALPRHANDK